MATPINAPLTSEIWHLSIDDLLEPLPQSPRLGGPGPFVINLSASTAPISQPTTSIAECPGAHVYQIQRTEDRRVRYRLRLGPFLTEDEADALLPRVREIYPSALTATAEIDDLRAIETWKAKAEAQQVALAKAAARAAAEAQTAERAAPAERAAAAERGAAAERTAAAASLTPKAPVSATSAHSGFDPASIPVLSDSVEIDWRSTTKVSMAAVLRTTSTPATATPTSPLPRTLPPRTLPTTTKPSAGLTSAPAATVSDARPSNLRMAARAAAGATPAMPLTTVPLTAAPVPPAPKLPQAATTTAAPVAAQRRVEALSTPLASLESTQTLRPLTPREIEDPSALRWFVIQLSESENGFDPDLLPNLDIFGEYRLYTVAGVDQGRPRHTLRLGFFREESAAAAVAGYLSAFYENPVVKRVSAAERQRFAEQQVDARKDIGATGRHMIIEITNERVVRERRANGPAGTGAAGPGAAGK